MQVVMYKFLYEWFTSMFKRFVTPEIITNELPVIMCMNNRMIFVFNNEIFVLIDGGNL